MSFMSRDENIECQRKGNEILCKLETPNGDRIGSIKATVQEDGVLRLDGIKGSVQLTDNLRDKMKELVNIKTPKPGDFG